MEQISQRLQNQLAQFQQIQQQAQAIATQRFQLELQLKEIERALAELNKLGSRAEIYKSVGPLLIKDKKTAVGKELEEKKDTLDLRIKTLQRQELKVQKRLKEMQERIEEEIKAEKGGYGKSRMM